jgi:hypothetical protein
MLCLKKEAMVLFEAGNRLLKALLSLLMISGSNCNIS